MSANVPVLELKRVTKKFGDFTAVSNASFRIHRGEVVGFVGANGAGKTTTISIILGFIKPTTGLTKLFTHITTPANAHISHQRIGYAAGDMELPQRLTGRQYLKFTLRQHRGGHSARLNDLIELFKPELSKKIGELSRGNKQKIALIAAFMTEPKVVVLDEPTSGLDPIMQEVFRDLVRREHENGTTIFMSSHYLPEVADVCSRVILMRQGKIVQDIATNELLGGGKYVSVTTGYKSTKPPKGARDVELEEIDGQLELSFMWNGDMTRLQAWLASVKRLTDVNITEHDLEALAHSLYESEDNN